MSEAVCAGWMRFLTDSRLYVCVSENPFYAFFRSLYPVHMYVCMYVLFVLLLELAFEKC